jgi:hypothetical protein
MKKMPGGTAKSQHTRCCKDLGHQGGFVTALVAGEGFGNDAVILGFFIVSR